MVGPDGEIAEDIFAVDRVGPNMKRLIAYQRLDITSGRSDISIVTVATNQVTTLDLPGTSIRPTWPPDGRHTPTLSTRTMTTSTVSATGRVQAPARVVYDLIADYRDGHTRIIPPKYFKSLDVESGGIGDGTLIRVTMHILGADRTYRAKVTEPEPGRVITETDLETGLATSFTVTPSGSGSEVTISTKIPHFPGVVAAIQRWLVRRTLPQIYREELRLIAAQVRA